MELKCYVLWMVIECRNQRLNKICWSKGFQSHTVKKRASQVDVKHPLLFHTLHFLSRMVLDISCGNRYSHFKTLHADVFSEPVSGAIWKWGYNSTNSSNFVKVEETKIHLITVGYIKVFLIYFSHLFIPICAFKLSLACHYNENKWRQYIIDLSVFKDSYVLVLQKWRFPF